MAPLQCSPWWCARIICGSKRCCMCVRLHSQFSLVSVARFHFFFFLSLRLFPMPFSIRVRFFRSRRFSMHSRSIPFARCVFCESERERAEVCKWINACDFLCCGFLCSQYSYEWKFIVKSDHVFWYAVLMLALPITQCGFCSRWRQRWRRRRRRQPRC